MNAAFTVAGFNHRGCPVALREQIYVEDVEQPEMLARFREAGVAEILILSTCDRVELWMAGDEATALAALDRLVVASGLDPAALAGYRHLITGEAALRHAFAVAASLESQVIGEPQVLGQVKAAHRLARDIGMVGPVLEPVLQAAYQAAKRVRTETAIGERPVSLAAAACQLARDVQGDLSRCAALLLGTGEMGEFLTAQLLAAGLGRVTVIGRTARRAEAVARRLGGHFATLEELPQALPGADIVVACHGEGRYTLSADSVEGALRQRKRRPVFLIDLAVPGDIEPSVNRLDDAFLYDLGELEQVALDGRSRRESASGAAWALVEAELAAFGRHEAEREAVPALTALRGLFEAARQTVLDDLPEGEERAAIDRATRLLVNRLLHRPSAGLRRLAAEGRDQAAAEALLRRLFLDAGDEEPKDEE